MRVGQLGHTGTQQPTTQHPAPQGSRLPREDRHIEVQRTPAPLYGTLSRPPHPIGHTIHQLALVMEGQLDELVNPLVTHYQAEKLKAETVAA